LQDIIKEYIEVAHQPSNVECHQQCDHS